MSRASVLTSNIQIGENNVTEQVNILHLQLSNFSEFVSTVASGSCSWPTKAESPAVVAHPPQALTCCAF